MSIYKRCPEQANLQDRADEWCPGLGERPHELLLCKGYRKESDQGPLWMEEA